MEPGLRAEQKPAAEAWVKNKINEVVSFLTTPVNYPSQTAKDQALANAQTNPFFGKVSEIFASAAGITDPSAKDLFIRNSLDELAKNSQKAMETGMPKKGFWEIFKNGLTNLNPVGLLGNGIASMISGGSFFDSIFDSLKIGVIGSIKDAAIAWGGDETAAWMKAFKNNNLDGLFSKTKPKPMTTDDAARALATQNAASALASVLGIDPKNNQFINTVVREVEETRVAPPPAAGPPVTEERKPVENQGIHVPDGTMVLPPPAPAMTAALGGAAAVAASQRPSK